MKILKIFSEGKIGNVNLDGTDFYNKLIDALLDKGLQFHLSYQVVCKLTPI